MRPVILTDVIGAARTLLAAPRGSWGPLLRRTLARAEEADRHRLATRAPHPLWGNGSLLDALHGHPRAPEPPLADPRYLEALIAVLTALRHPSGLAMPPRPPISGSET